VRKNLRINVRRRKRASRIAKKKMRNIRRDHFTFLNSAMRTLLIILVS
jgi:hypothetical protein